MPRNTWWYTKDNRFEIYYLLCDKRWYAKFLSDEVTFSIFSSNIQLNFRESVPVVPLKYLMYFLAGINTK